VENGRKNFISKRKNLFEKKKLKKKQKLKTLTKMQITNNNNHQYFVLEIKISKNPNDFFEDPKRSFHRKYKCKGNNVRQFNERGMRNFSFEEKLQFIEKRLNFLNEKSKQLDSNDPRKQRIENKISFLSQRKSKIQEKMENHENKVENKTNQIKTERKNETPSPKERKSVSLSYEERRKMKLEKIKQKILHLSGLLRNPEIEQSRRAKIMKRISKINQKREFLENNEKEKLEENHLFHHHKHGNKKSCFYKKN
jgi:hypothetical protein